MGLFSYFRRIYYNQRLKKADKLFEESRILEAEQLLNSILNKHPLAAGRLVTLYDSVASRYGVSKAVELFKKSVHIKDRSGSLYDKQSYDNGIKQFATHTNDRAVKCFSSKSFSDCYSLLYELNGTVYKTKESVELCCQARIQMIFQGIESTKSTGIQFGVWIDEFRNEWVIGETISKMSSTCFEFCDKLEAQKRFYASNSILLIVLGDRKNAKLLDNAVKIVSTKDIEASTEQIKETVYLFGANSVLRKDITTENAVAIFDSCWKLSHNYKFVMEVFQTNKNDVLFGTLKNYIFSNHASYFSDGKLLEEFSKWIYEKIEAPLSIEILEKLHKFGYNVENFYVKKLHTWIAKKSCEEKVKLLDYAQSLFPNANVVLLDKLECAHWYLDNNENDKAILVADSILAKCEKATLIKAYAMCNLAYLEPDICKRVEGFEKSIELLGEKTELEYNELREYILTGLFNVSDMYYSSGSLKESYEVLHKLSKYGYSKALISIAIYRLKEIQNSTAVDLKLTISLDAIAEISSFKNPIVYDCLEYSSIWDEYLSAVISNYKQLEHDKVVKELEKIIAKIDESGFNGSIKKSKLEILKKEIIRRKYLIARNFELANKLEDAMTLYKEISHLEGKKTQTLSSLRLLICKQKSQDDSNIIQNKDKIYTLLRSATITFKSEKEDIAYRFALTLLRFGEDKEALSVLSEFLPKEENLKKACEQSDIIRAQAKLEDFNKKVESVNSRTLPSADAVYLINHMLEYAHIINPILQLNRPVLSKYREKLKNYAIYKLFDEGKFSDALGKMMKVYPDYMDNLTALRNISIVCLNMAEGKQISTSNYKKVISIWLTAIYQEKLFIKSLDYTSWDDNFTFSLYGAYGNFDENSVGELPDNVNFDNPEEDDENKIVSIQEVQKALLSRFEVAIQDNNQYHEFFTDQKEAMDSFIELHLDEKCRLVAPYLVKESVNVFNDISNALEKHRDQKYDNWEDILHVGNLYHIEKSVYTDYGNAKGYYRDCINAIDTHSICSVKAVFIPSKVSLIRNFKKLYTAFLSYVTSKISGLSPKDKADFTDNFNFYTAICETIKDATLSYTFSNYVMSFVVSRVNEKTMNEVEASEYILPAYLLDKNNTRIKENLTTLFKMLLAKNDSKSVQVVSAILKKIQTFDSSFYAVLKSVQETLKTQIEVNSIIEKITKGRMKMSDALKSLYNIYSNNPNNSVICELLATICSACIMEYIIGSKPESRDVQSIFDSLKPNMSSEFRKHRDVFRKQYNEIWNKLPYDAKRIFRGESLHDMLNENGRALEKALRYYKIFGGIESFFL